MQQRRDRRHGESFRCGELRVSTEAEVLANERKVVVERIDRVDHQLRFLQRLVCRSTALDLWPVQLVPTRNVTASPLDSVAVHRNLGTDTFDDAEVGAV